MRLDLSGYILGQECCNDYFNEAVGGDSLVTFLLTSTSSRTHALWSLLWMSYCSKLVTYLNCANNNRKLQQMPPLLFME